MKWRNGTEMPPGLLYVLMILLLFIAVLPTWPFSRGWGYYPVGGLGLLLLIALIIVVL